MAEFTFDLRRRDRVGLDEAVMSVGRSASQIDAIIDDVKDKLRGLLLTRLDPAKFADLRASRRTLLDYDAVSHTAVLGQPLPSNGAGNVAIVMAGTSDVPMGARPRARSCLTGKASANLPTLAFPDYRRSSARIDDIRKAPVVIVAAGMDAALIGVVGGLVAGAVIGLPTSVGYELRTAERQLCTPALPAVPLA